MPYKSINLIVSLPQELSLGKPIRHQHSLELPVTPPKAVPVCPHCHSPGCISKGSDGFQSIRHVPSGNVGVFLTFKKQRFYCAECLASFTYHYPWQHHPLPVTDALYLSILSDLSRPVTIPDIAAKNCVTDNIVRGVLKSIDIPKCPALPEIVCIDDFRGNAGAYNPKRKKWDAPVFQTCVVDGLSGRIIDILRDRSSATVQEFFLSFPESQRKNVKFYSCDMSGIYAAAARKIFPDAVLCVDRFHVVQWLNKAVDAVRRRLQNEFRNIPAKYSKLKDSRLMLLTKECSQRTYWEAYGYEEKLARLQTLLAEFPDLCEVFDALQEYHFICAVDTEPIRRLKLTEWINKYLSSEVGEVRDAAKTVENWKENILNSFTHGITNGPVEALNNQIKRLKKISCGVHDFESFRKRILLCFGTTSFVRNQYTIFGEKHAQKISIKKEDLDHD
ncbi:MAG: ISL3 family transposase [Lachnospiraceae bacterium]|nr:ISL3 family transposase [Lachnospiraceae bacterium]